MKNVKGKYGVHMRVEIWWMSVDKGLAARKIKYQ